MIEDNEDRVEFLRSVSQAELRGEQKACPEAMTFLDSFRPQAGGNHCCVLNAATTMSNRRPCLRFRTARFIPAACNSEFS